MDRLTVYSTENLIKESWGLIDRSPFHIPATIMMTPLLLFISILFVVDFIMSVPMWSFITVGEKYDEAASKDKPRLWGVVLIPLLALSLISIVWGIPFLLSNRVGEYRNRKEIVNNTVSAYVEEERMQHEDVHYMMMNRYNMINGRIKKHKL